ncbi:MAG: hypothetical protein LBB14_02050, partial [Puniceicoccales bacterium]|nr:hypothetical protein [Puniceicoccales bacterium]
MEVPWQPFVLLSLGSLIFSAPSPGANQWDSASFSIESESVMFRIDGNTYLTADRLRWTEGVVEADGAVLLGRGRDLLLAKNLHYSLKDSTFGGSGIRFRVGNFYAQSESVEGVGGDGLRWITFRSGRIYRGEPAAHSPNFSGQEISLAGDGTVRLSRASVLLGNRCLLTVPHWQQNLWQSPIRLRVKCGRRTDLGIYVRNDLSLALTPQLRLFADLEYYGARGVLLGPGGRWDGPIFGQNTQAELFTGWIRDRRAPDFSGASVRPRRNFMEGTYRQPIGRHGDIAGELLYRSDPYVLWDFRPGHRWHGLRLGSHIELNYWWRDSILTADLVGGGDRRRGKSLQELRLRTVPRAIFAKPLAGSYSIALTHNKISTDSPATEFVKLDGTCGLELPLRWRNAVVLRPCTSVRSLVYDVRGEEDFPYRAFAQAGADLRALIEGDWPITFPLWDIGFIRHRISPLLQYRCTWERRRGTAPEHYSLDDSNLPNLDLCELSNPDGAAGGSRLRLGLENVFQSARARGNALRTIAEFSLYEDFLFGERPTPANIYGTLRFRPAEFFSLNFFSRTDGKSFMAKMLRLETELWDGNFWKIA